MAVTDVVLDWGAGRVRFASDPPPESGERFVLTDLAGWYGGVGVRGETVDRLGHGVIGGRKWRTRRALTLRGHVEVADAEDRDRVMRELSGVLWDGLEGTLSATVDGLRLSSTVVLDGEPGIVPSGARSVTVQLPLSAADPFLYGDEQVVFLHPIGTGVGLEYPLYGPTVDPDGEPVLTYGSATTSQDPVANAGNAAAWPVFVVVGDFPSGVLIRDGGRVVSWPHPVVPQSPVRIDMSGAVWVGDTNQTHLAASRQWFSVPAGSTVHPEFEPVQFGSGWCEVHLRDTYI